MESFDQFFLFITSVLGLFFSLFYALLGYREIIYGFLPLLVIGLVIPIYIGYVRGAILLDMLEERVRGWVYFLIGVIYYLASILLFGVNRLLQVLNVEFEALSGFIFFVGMLLVGYFFGWRKLYRWFCRNIFGAFNHKMTELTDKIYRDTSSSAFYTSLFLYIAFNFSLSQGFHPAIPPIMVASISMGLIHFASYEWNIRKWVNLVRFSDFIEIESKKTMPPILRRFGRILYFVYVIIAGVAMLIWEWLTVPVVIGLASGLLGSMIIVTLSIQEEYNPVIKKDVPKDIETELTKLINRITKKKEKGKKPEKD